MSNKLKSKFARITDLFIQGDTCYLGDDEKGVPVCVWVMKTTSLQEDEARMDGQAARSRKLVELAGIGNSEYAYAQMIVSDWNDEELVNAITNQEYDTFILGALADVEADPEWKDSLEYLRREPGLMDDANLPEDDERRTRFTEVNNEHTLEIGKRVEIRQNKRKGELEDMDREEREGIFLESHKKKLAQSFMNMEARITRLYYATRECEAGRNPDGSWNHDKCDHGKMLCPARKDVRELPEEVLVKISECYDSLSVGLQRVANFPAPQNG